MIANNTKNMFQSVEIIIKGLVVVIEMIMEGLLFGLNVVQSFH